MNLTQPAQWQIVEGAAQIIIDSKPCVMEIVPNEFSLPNNEPYVFAIDVTFLESINMDRNLLFMWVDENNWYDIKVTNNEVRLQKVVNGISYELPSSVTTFPFVINRTYHLEVLLAESKIQLKVNNNQLLSVTDELPLIEHQAITIGLEAGVGALRRSVTRFDNLQVFLLDASDLFASVPKLKQGDPAWGQLEYDHARQWSNRTTIQNWGCALTSLAMIMQFHGLEKMPDGTALTPASLNEWLKLQPDGYLGEGLVNFLASTRLSKQLSTLFGTPALEYGRVNWSADTGLTPAIEEITQQRPVMVQIPGHFLVADGVTPDQSDLTINDPAYSYTTLSQHQVNPLSFRMFYPSFTDLSYILIVFNQDTNITLVGPTSMIPIEIDEQLTTFSQDETTESNSPTRTLSVAKPSNGQYLLEVNSANNHSLKFTVFTYDTNGEVTQHVLSQPNLGITQEYLLEYSTQLPSTIHRISSFSAFRQLLEIQLDNQAFANPLAWWWLDHAVEQAVQDSASTSFYKNYLSKLLSWYQPSIVSEAQSTLLAELAIIPE